MSTRDLIENYSTYTTAVEMSHSSAADTTARSTPVCSAIVSGLVSASVDATFDFAC